MRDTFLLKQYINTLESAALCARLSPEGNIRWMSESLHKLLEIHYLRQTTAFTAFLHIDSRPHVAEGIKQASDTGESWNGTLCLQSNSRSRWCRCMAIPLYGTNGELVEQVLLFQDISREIYLDELLEEARFDQVTGLPTRVDLLSDLKRVGAQSLAVLDIRQFRSYADFHGLEFGDELLREFSTWASAYLKTKHINLYRLYSDKFALIPDFRMIPNLFEDHLLNFYQALLSKRLAVGNNDVALDVAIGMGVGRNKQLQLAESALSKAKAIYSGYKIEVVYEREFLHENKVNWLPKIQSALVDHRFINYYQPIKSTKKDKPSYYEALVRLRDNNKDLAPGLFLDKAKTTRYYCEITRSVIEQAVLASEQYQVAISVNVSIEDILNDETVNFIHYVLAEHKRAQLIFEITETESTEDFTKVQAFANDVRRLGGQIAIDDFGVGYSNFSRLISLRPDYLKIDGSIVQNVLHDPTSASILNGLISICKELSIPIVAEFVENEDVNGYLRDQQIEYLQGYYIGKPAPEMNRLLN
ncbi:EAL domain-containing protein (putative c-di-GMP-specific phosphodiesterase class I) [Idiomarina loihiensis]|uniref:EAL domain-containing protein n=1 Tax=Idiomarina TaxID=135575 RepID=UPI000D712F6B|nr:MULTISPECIES: bifunctional diguanylate cyclase/phosphodiesterase [Idiomarina]PWW39424.1 EAL domain-containing protein (putative c-di-GMP-specific phosphodiesterase class I) [Idiomarina loihiensis]TDP49481.1 EAL domain-containing protein (putative c-di-GMP-specific phosphodiesterase class I) [Idiomarina loihiensis]TDS24205.1 EAL domain-containing protein (putative c-di-GMP-specific phosphodiesterase class I) [Idiomarina sp. H2]